MTRQSRKQDHIQYFLETTNYEINPHMEDIHLMHCCLPEMNIDDISMKTDLMGFSLAYPIFINALTGGASDVTAINAALARVAKRYKIPMAVGSQMAALEDSTLTDSYKIVRKENPEGVVFANIGAYATVKMVQEAVNMIDANAIQIHLNAAQELLMPEGDREFSQWLFHIEKIVKAISIPVIVKEVGFGIRKEDAQKLLQTGVHAIDIGGTGGTNFISIESLRRNDSFAKKFIEWGIPTPVSLIEVSEVLSKRCSLIASGGISNGLDVVKMLALGANAVGMSGVFLRELLTKDELALEKCVSTIIDEIRTTMALVGVKDIASLNQIPVVVMGKMAEWLTIRGIDIRKYGMRE